MDRDIESSRVTHVHAMEQQMRHLREEHDKFKAIAEKWEPIVTTKVDAETQKTTFGLRFGGKNVHATVSQQFLKEMDTTGAVTQLVDALIESLVVEQISKVLRPEVERVQQSIAATAGAGKW